MSLVCQFCCSISYFVRFVVVAVVVVEKSLLIHSFSFLLFRLTVHSSLAMLARMVMVYRVRPMLSHRTHISINW